MPTRVSIIFPYNVPKDERQIFDRLLNIIKYILQEPSPLNTSNKAPILVVNKDTIRKGVYDAFYEFLQKGGEDDILDRLNVLKTWSVDTCQMWLAGFGKILDDNDDNAESQEQNLCVLQIPGDLKYVGGEQELEMGGKQGFESFLKRLELMRHYIEAEWHLVIGDFTVKPFGSKHIIDLYGTYPLLYNWFPDVAKRVIKQIGIRRPRSEFIGAKIEFLEFALSKRKFAYEQTVALLVHAIYHLDEDDKREWRINKIDLGTIADYEEVRGFKEANDQLERTERMLRLLWREKHGGDDYDILEFERLERRSRFIREAAVVSFKNFLEVDVEPGIRKTMSQQVDKKVAGSLPRWLAFRGFSLLFDNPGNGVTHNGDVVKLNADLSDTNLQLYRRLAITLDDIEQRLPLHTLSFCRLPADTYHVTVWDGVNDGNVDEFVSVEQDFKAFLNELPDSLVRSDMKVLIEELENSMCITSANPITFRFERFIKWGNELLVAELKPKDDMDKIALDRIVRQRTDLYKNFNRNNRRLKTEHSYQPHITLGYFTEQSKASKLDQKRIDKWSEECRSQCADITIAFKSISLYGFTDMVTFFKAA